MSTPDQHRIYQQKAVTNFLDSLNKLRNAGVSPGSDAFRRLQAGLNEYLPLVGTRVPRPTVFILRLLGLSPGSLSLFHGGDFGWTVALRELAGATPHYKTISDELAIHIVKDGLTHEEFMELSRPDDYLGE